MVLDFPISETKREEYKQYRTQLRELTKLSGFPHNFDWPVQPE